MNSPYKTKQHRRWRELVLRRDMYRCQMCKRFGRNVEATEAHHIIPLQVRPDLGRVLSNGVGLCRACHNALEPRTGEYAPPDWMLKRVGEGCV